MANPNNVAGGYKATIHKPNVSDEAKDNAREHLSAMQEHGEIDHERANPEPVKDAGQKFIGGNKHKDDHDFDFDEE